ncbi:nitroreductase family protein [Psychrilyobacter atlanticus]|uniref:nitroreductase family protein n=1 Tax=Psychrilyobacter atlanticus TaxID=271091 RepID=UPI00040E6CC4|nr:nitroreductase family protein [Psychrilyobacter atlanticus]
MDFLELAKKRYSVRKFRDKKVEKEKIDLILEAGRLAPTAVNYQPQRILVLESDESLEKLKECSKYHFDAPLAILVCYDNTVSWKRRYDDKDMGEVDASIVATQMMLEITNLNLGTTWVGHFDPQKIRDIFSLPENIIPVALFPVGYPHEKSVPHQLHEKRLEISETVVYDSFKK